MTSTGIEININLTGTYSLNKLILVKVREFLDLIKIKVIH